MITQNQLKGKDKPQYALNNEWLKIGTNTIVIKGQPLKPINAWTAPNKQPGVIQILTKASNWQRKLFNGKAQVIIQSDGKAGDIVLKASAEGIKSKELLIRAE